MSKYKKTIKIVFGKKSNKTAFGLVGCSHGMYSRGGYNRWIYGIKYLIGIHVNQTWGNY